MAISPAKKPPSSRLPTWDTRGKARRGCPKIVVADSGEGIEADWKDLEQHSSHGQMKQQMWNDYVATQLTQVNGLVNK